MVSGEVLPNLGSTKLRGTRAVSGSPLQIGTQVGEITKPLASIDEMVSNGMKVSMHTTGGVAKRLDLEVERQIRDLVKGGKGSEVILERAGGSFTFGIDVKSQNGEGWKEPKKPAKAGNRSMEVDQATIAQSYCNILWEEQEYDEVMCAPCEPFFQRQ